MKYDDASWHYGGEFPEDLPDEAGSTHIGMFVAWSLLSGLGGSLHVEECPEDLAELRARKITPGAFLLRACDEKFTDEDLNGEGNEFAKVYFQSDKYLDDYESTVGEDLPSLYHVADNWKNFDTLKVVLDKRYEAWRNDT